MKKNYKNNLIIIFLIILLILYIKDSQLIITSLLDYTFLFLEKLFPASFIFFIISSLLIDYNFIEKISKLLHINGAIFYVVVMSIISGFPSGSKYIKDLYCKSIINLNTANYLITFTHFPNPIFILGSVSLLFKNKLFPLLILLVLITSNIIIGILLKPRKKQKISYTTKNIESFSKLLSKAIIDSFKTMILIYGTSVFFYLIISVINNYIHLRLYHYIIVNGLFDLTKGIFLTSIVKNEILKSIFIIFFISFGGISINMQVKSIIADTKINYYKFLLGRLFQFILSSTLFLLIIYWSHYIN